MPRVAVERGIASGLHGLRGHHLLVIHDLAIELTRFRRHSEMSIREFLQKWPHAYLFRFVVGAWALRAGGGVFRIGWWWGVLELLVVEIQLRADRPRTWELGGRLGGCSSARGGWCLGRGEARIAFVLELGHPLVDFGAFSLEEAALLAHSQVLFKVLFFELGEALEFSIGRGLWLWLSLGLRGGMGMGGLLLEADFLDSAHELVLGNLFVFEGQNEIAHHRGALLLALGQLPREIVACVLSLPLLRKLLH